MTIQHAWDPNVPYHMSGGDYRFTVDVPEGVVRFDIIITAGQGTIVLEAEKEEYQMPHTRGHDE